MPPGTVVTCRRLFFNAPVRAKFLRSGRAELGRSVSAVQRLAFARCDVSFKCTVEGRLALQTPGNGDLRETVLAIFGLEAARDVLQVGSSDGKGSSVVALVGGPATGRADRRRQGIWVNRRPVAVRGMLEALETAYPLGVLPGRRHPLLFVFLELPPAEVDANVHPTKAEVRMQRQNDAFALAISTVGGVAHAVRDAAPGGAVATDPDAAAETAAEASAETAAALHGAGGRRRRQDAGAMHAGRPYQSAYSAPPQDIFREQPGLWPDPAARASGPSGASLDLLRPLGQSGGRWLACDGPGGLYLVDQHAAHERVIFERLGLERAAVTAAQPLAVPVAVDLDPAEFEAWRDLREALDASGLRTEHFGEKTILVREVPLSGTLPGAGGEAIAPGDLLLDVLASMSGEAAAASALPPRLRARRAIASCLAAVKANQALSEPEMAALLKDLAACAEPWKCPHGRPTVVFLDHEELARRFGR
jgi:DNA mismatch repair protein MutL